MNTYIGLLIIAAAIVLFMRGKDDSYSSIIVDLISFVILLSVGLVMVFGN